MSLDAFFTPRSIAVLGASANPGKLGYTLLNNVIEMGFQGAIHPVNPRGGVVLDRPAAASVRDLAGQVDLALISIPNAQVPGAVADCAAARVRAAVILSSGFGETGADGRAVQEQLRRVARAAGMRLMGPNCMGVYNPAFGLNGSYFWSLPRKVGAVSFVSQSGAMGGLFFADARARGLGVAKFASVGNTADVEHADLLEYLGADPDTGVIGLFIEGIRDGARFLAAARRVAPQKPVVALKGGRTGAGARAAASHTGSMAGAGQLYRAALEEVGIHWAQSSDEFFDALATLAAHRDRLPASRNLAVLTISGGPSVLAADACEERGLAVPPLAPETQAAVRALTPDFAAVSNPVDMTPQVTADNIPACLDRVLADPAVDGAIFINLGLDFPQFGEGLKGALARHGKPIVALLSAAPGIAAVCDEVGIPLFGGPERAVQGYAALVRRRETLARLAANGGGVHTAALSGLPASPLALLPGAPDEHDAKRALAAYGLPVTREERVESLEGALAAAKRLGYPVALKVCRAGVAHKTEAGGVRLGLAGPVALSAAWAELAARFDNGPYLVQEMVPGGVELLLGARRDPTLGAFVAFGPGGIFTELIGDVTLVPAPLSPARALQVVQASKAGRLLAGFRGQPPADMAAVAAALVALGNFVAANPQVAEVDVNPLFARPDGCMAADALVVLEQGRQV